MQLYIKLSFFLNIRYNKLMHNIYFVVVVEVFQNILEIFNGEKNINIIPQSHP